MISSNRKLKIFFWLLTLSVFFVLTLPYLIQDAMFQDAMLYSSVSHNLGNGIGTFWNPQYSTLNIAGIPSFHEHPPLVFGIQSIFFWAFGDSIFIEKFYTLGMIILTIVLITLLWKKYNLSKPEIHGISWLPIFYWSMVPIVFWNFRYNMMENTMGIFILLSVIVSYHNLNSGNTKLALWALSGFFIFLASFSKGIPGLFPVVVPAVYWLCTRRITFKQAMLYSLILAGIPILIYAILLMFTVSRESLENYFFKRVLWRIDQLPTTDNRFNIIISIFRELLPMMFITTVLYLIGLKKRIKIAAVSNDALFFILTGCAGAVPLVLTFCQRDWYLVPTFPFFAIGFAIFSAPIVAHYVGKINTRSVLFNCFFALSLLIFTGVLVYTGMQKGKIGRYENIVTDVRKIGTIVPKYSTITVPSEMYDEKDFVLQGFLVRYYNISISPYKQYEYFLKLKSINTPLPDNYIPVNLNLMMYDLYKIKS